MSNLPALQGLLGRTAVQGLVLAALVLSLLVVGALRRRGAVRTATATAGLGSALAVTAALVLTLRPLADGPAVRTLYLDPVAGAWGWDSIAWNPVIDNVALFVPIGALLAATAWRRSTGLVWFGCVVFSVGVETLQYLVPTGRVANVADVLANAVGALVGIVLAALLGARRPPSPGRDRLRRRHAAAHR